MDTSAETRLQSQLPPYPPAPWDLAGELWMGLFRLHPTAKPVVSLALKPFQMHLPGAEPLQ